MKTRRFFTWFGLIALALFLSFGFLEVLEKRFAEGGVYPHYASFRSDPLGTSALYESLSAIPGTVVRRNITHLNSVPDLDEGVVLLLLGVPRENFGDLRAGEDSPVLKAVRDGARLVITVNPGLVPEKFQPVKTEEEQDWFERRRQLREERIRSEEREDKDTDTENENENEKDDAISEEEEALELAMDESLGQRLSRRLGFALESLEEFERPEGGWDLTPGRKSAVTSLPGWYSQFRFEPESKAWKTIAKAEGGPVVIERRYGKGSVVLASDSFFVSNEALHLEPVPEFLAWMLGGKSNIVFDETIHGSQESGGAMKLIRRYRMQGVFFGLLVFVALWAWRSSSPLAPGDDDFDLGLVEGSGAVAGEETSSGLIRMLRRSIEPSSLLQQCFLVWRESRQRTLRGDVEGRIQEILREGGEDRKHHDPVPAYRRITDCLRRH